MDLEAAGQRCQPFHQHMVHQRLAHFQRMRHAGAVHLGVDVPNQPGFVVQVLDERQGIIGLCILGMLAEHLQCAVAAQAALECG